MSMRRSRGVVAVGLCLALGGCAGDTSLAPATPGPVGLQVTEIALPAPSTWARAADRHVAELGAVRVEVSPETLTVRDDAGATASLRTRRAGPAAVERVDDRTLRLWDGRAVEELRLGADGYEQSWRYDVSPGRVAVTVDVEQLSLDRADGEGLHLRGPGSLRLRYGHGTWVDADGRRTPVAATWRGGAIVLEVPDDVVAASRFPAVLDPEVAVEAQPAVSAYAPTYPLALTAGGPGYLLWWAPTDRLDTTPGEGQRLDAAGRVIDRTVFRLPRPGAWLRVARAGTGWLLFSRGPGGVPDVYELPGTGDPLATPSPSSEAGAGDTRLYDVVDDAACGASDCMTVGTWRSTDDSDLGDTGRLAGSIRDLRGRAPTSLARSRLHFEIAAVTGPRVAPAAGGFLVAWTDVTFGTTSRDARVVKVRADGTLAEPEGHAVSSWGYDRVAGCLASNGTSALLVWSASRATGTRAAGVYASQLDDAGAPVGDPRYLGTGGAARCTLSWTGTQYVLARAGRMRLDATGTPLGPVGAAEPAQSLAAGTASSLLVVNSSTLGAATYGVTNTPVGPVTGLYAYIQAQSAAALFHDGSDLFVTWVTEGDGGLSGGYRAMRVRGGLPMMPTSTAVPIPLASGPFLAAVQGLQGAFNGSDYLLLNSPYSVSTSRYGIATISLDRSGGTTRAAATASIFGSSTKYSFERMRNTTSGFIAAQRCRSVMWIGPGYDVTSRSPYVVGNGPPDGCAASMETIGDTVYFAFVNWDTSPAPGVYGIRFDRNGDPIDGSPRRITTSVYTGATLYAGGGRLLLVLSLGTTFRTIELMPDWTVVRDVPGPGTAPWRERVFDGTQHVLINTDGDIGYPFRRYVTAQRMSSHGDRLDAAPIRVAEITGSPLIFGSVPISVASLGDGVTYVAYAKNDPLVSRTRISLVSISNASLGADAGADASTADTGVADAVVDAGARDAGTDAPVASDLGSPDAGARDVPATDRPASDGTVAVADTGPSDAAFTDVATADVATADAASADAVVSDAVTTDVAVDAATMADAVVSDAVSTDVAVDRTAPADAVTTDVAVDRTAPADAAGGGIDVGGGTDVGGRSGCSCTTAGDASSPRSAWWLLALVALPRRRRERA